MIGSLHVQVEHLLDFPERERFTVSFSSSVFLSFGGTKNENITNMISHET